MSFCKVKSAVFFRRDADSKGDFNGLTFVMTEQEYTAVHRDLRVTQTHLAEEHHGLRAVHKSTTFVRSRLCLRKCGEE